MTNRSQAKNSWFLSYNKPITGHNSWFRSYNQLCLYVHTAYWRVEVCWVLPDVLTNMHGRCLYLGSHPGSVHNARRPLWGYDLPYAPEYWGFPHNYIYRYPIIRVVGAVQFCRLYPRRSMSCTYIHWNWNFVYIHLHRRAGSGLNTTVLRRCDCNSRSVPCLRVWVRGPVG